MGTSLFVKMMPTISYCIAERRLSAHVETRTTENVEFANSGMPRRICMSSQPDMTGNTAHALAKHSRNGRSVDS